VLAGSVRRLVRQISTCLPRSVASGAGLYTEVPDWRSAEGHPSMQHELPHYPQRKARANARRSDWHAATCEPHHKIRDLAQMLTAQHYRKSNTEAMSFAGTDACCRESQTCSLAAPAGTAAACWLLKSDGPCCCS